MNLDALVTRLEVNSRGELVVGFRNLGTVYFPKWKHLFPTKILGRETSDPVEQGQTQKKYEGIEYKIGKNPRLAKFKKQLKKRYWWIYQIFCPVSFKDDLPEEFVGGHYTQQARWQLPNPGNCVELDSELLEILERKRNIEGRLGAVRSCLNLVKKRADATRTFNALNDLFDSYDGANFQDIKNRAGALQGLEGLLLLRKEIADEIFEANRVCSQARITYARAFKGKKDRVLRVEQDDWKYLRRETPGEGEAKIQNPRVRMPSPQELLDKKWLFLDIEIPHFRRENPRISWVGLSYVEAGKVRREIYTLYDVGAQDIEGFRIFMYRSERELVSSLAERINQENPDVVSSYNTRFDLIKLRESAARFPIGDEETDPLFRATTPFFERIGIKDRLVIDLLRWQKIARAFDINAKLEVAAGFEKEISYAEMAELEDQAMHGDQTAAARIAHYLAGDVTHLSNLFFSEEFRKTFEDACWLSGTFGVGLERILHSANSINDAQEREYFRALGIYREEVPPHLRTKQMQQRKTKARASLQDRVFDGLIMPGEIKGLSRGVYKVHVPQGDFFEDLVVERFSQVRKFSEYKRRFKGDKRRLFFLEQYGREFARWLREDYGSYLEEADSFYKMIEGMNRSDFEGAYHALRRRLERDFPAGLSHLNNGELKLATLEENIPEELASFLRASHLKPKKFLQIANQRSVVKRRVRNMAGNYGLFPSRDFLDSEDEGVQSDHVIEETLQRKIDELNSFLTENKFQIVAREGNHLYLVGGTRETLLCEDCPVTLVDEIPSLYNADNPYYSKSGFFSHMRSGDDPSFNLNLFEMRTFGRMLQNLLTGRNREAMNIYQTALEDLREGRVSLQDLVFFNKTRERYFAYDPTSDSENGRTYFVEDARFAEGEVREDKQGKYFLDEGTKVYIATPDSLKPNTKMYKEKFVGRAREILAPVFPEFSRTKKSPVRKDPNQLSLGFPI